METSEETAGERLSKTALREFCQPSPCEERDYDLPSYRVTLSLQEAPIPVLLRHALTLIGISHSGPGEKVAWWMAFTYRGYPCELAHQTFGLRLSVGGDPTEERAGGFLAEMRKKLVSAVRIVETLLVETAGDTLNAGNVSVVNQHRQLRRAYDYFRGLAINPDLVEDVHESRESASGRWSSFRNGKNVMAHRFLAGSTRRPRNTTALTPAMS